MFALQVVNLCTFAFFGYQQPTFSLIIVMFLYKLFADVRLKIHAVSYLSRSFQAIGALWKESMNPQKLKFSTELDQQALIFLWVYIPIYKKYLGAVCLLTVLIIFWGVSLP